MPTWLQVLLGGLGGGACTIFVQWLRSSDARHNTDRTVDADLQKHWTDTTLELVDALREELHDARKELSTLRTLPAKLAHLEESLDHIHALLSAMKSDNPAEINAAERRAHAFLRRMRGTDKKGNLRNEVQTAISAERIVKDRHAGDADTGKPD